MRICFDLDNTLCSGIPYSQATPYPGAKKLLKGLKDAGHTIIISTARGMGHTNGNPGKAMAELGQLTLQQLSSWGFPFDEFYMGKPAADLYIDDKAVPLKWDGSFDILRKEIRQKSIDHELGSLNEELNAINKLCSGTCQCRKRTRH